jgi:hypothetical protein
MAQEIARKVPLVDLTQPPPVYAPHPLSATKAIDDHLQN